MYCFRDAHSLHHFLKFCDSEELIRIIQDQLSALADFDDVPLGELAAFLILEAGDSTSTLGSVLGRNLADVRVEHCIAYADWFELIIIISDDGFGYDIFVPKSIADSTLVDFCVSKSITPINDAI